MISTLAIRPAGQEDILTIQHIACMVWPVAYWEILSPQQLQYMQRMMYSRDVLQRQMTVEQHRFFIAENGSPIGFAGASAADYFLPDNSDEVYWKLHKLYVLPFLQKTGAGHALLQTVMNEAKQQGATTLLLNVNRSNKAFHYYIKHGFTIVDTGDFDIGAGFYMNDYVMAKRLS